MKKLILSLGAIILVLLQVSWVYGAAFPLDERPVIVSNDPNAAGGVYAYVSAVDGYIYYQDGINPDVQVGLDPGVHPSLNNGRIIYRNDIDGNYHLWEGGVDQIVTDAMTFPGGEASINSWGVVALEKSDGIYTWDGVNLTNVLPGNVGFQAYRHPVIDRKNIISEYWDNLLGTVDIYRYNWFDVTSELVVSGINIDYPNQTYGAAPWYSEDPNSSLVHLAWQAWDGFDWEIFYSFQDTNVGGWSSPLQITDNGFDPIKGRYIDDMYPVISNDGTLTWASNDDWDIYSWTQSGGIQPVSTQAGVDEKYPSIGPGGFVTFAQYDSGTQAYLGIGSGFAQQGSGQIPEPSTLLLLLPLLGGMAFRIKKLKRKM